MIRGWRSALLLLALGGCVHYHAEPLVPRRIAADFDARTLTDGGLRAYLQTIAPETAAPWPRPSWDLPSLTLAAFYYHPDLDLARARWAVAQAARRSAGERPNPSLSVEAGYNVTTATPSPWIPLGVLDLPIETAGKRGYRVARAAQLSEAARLALATVAWQVRSRVRASLVAFQAADEAASLLETQQTLQAEYLRLLERQREEGALSGFDLRQARIAADGARFAWRDAERRRAEARVTLAEAVGLPARALEATPISFSGLDSLPEEMGLAEARQRALLGRSDILGALAEYRASQSALQLEIAKQYPDIHLGPGYEYDQGDGKWSLGLSLTLPVFNRNRGPIAEAQAGRREAAARFEALQASVAAEVDRALAGYGVARRQLADADALEADLQHQATAAQAMLDVGEIGRSELLGLELQLSASRLARLDVLTRTQQALAALEDALQSPLGVPASSWEEAPRVAGTAQRGSTP